MKKMVQTPSVVFTGIFILLFVFLLKPTLAQTVPADPSGPSVAQCGPRLMPLASCVQFVQGQASQPTKQCCDNLKIAYIQQRPCLCMFLNGTALASLPINTTLALELPAFCSPQINLSTCNFSELTAPRSLPPQTPPKGIPVTPTAEAPTITAATLAPTPSNVAFGMGKSSGYKLSGEDNLGVSVVVLTLLLAKLI